MLIFCLACFYRHVALVLYTRTKKNKNNKDLLKTQVDCSVLKEEKNDHEDDCNDLLFFLFWCKDACMNDW